MGLDPFLLDTMHGRLENGVKAYSLSTPDMRIWAKGVDTWPNAPVAPQLSRTAEMEEQNILPDRE